MPTVRAAAAAAAAARSSRRTGSRAALERGAADVGEGGAGGAAARPRAHASGGDGGGGGGGGAAQQPPQSQPSVDARSGHETSAKSPQRWLRHGREHAPSSGGAGASSWTSICTDAGIALAFAASASTVAFVASTVAFGSGTGTAAGCSAATGAPPLVRAPLRSEQSSPAKPG